MLEEIKIPGTDAAVDNPLSGALSALNQLAGTRTVEVDLPILKCKAFVRPVNGSEELRLRTMKASGAAFIKSFNKVIFEHVEFEGLKFENVDDFQQHLTPPDKAILVYALLDATFAKLPEKMITCPSCGQVDTHEPEPSALFHADTITKQWEDADFKNFKIEANIVEGFDVTYGMPVESERIKIIENKENSELRNELNETDDILSPIELFSVYIKSVKIVQGDEVFELTDPVKEILPLLRDMPMDLKAKLLEDQSIKELIEYSPNFYLDIQCSNPGCEIKHYKWDNINPEQDFFLKALSVYN